MLYVPLICWQIDRQGQQLDPAYIRVGEEYEFKDIVHAVSVG